MSRFAANFLAGLVSGGARGYSIGRQIKQDQAVDAVLEAKPEQSQGYTAEDGKKLEELASAKDAQGNALYTIGADADGNYTITPNQAGQGQDGGVTPSQVIQRHTVTDLMGDRFDGALTNSQVGDKKARKLVEAASLSDPMRGALASIALGKTDREEADRLELQQALRGGTAPFSPSLVAGDGQTPATGGTGQVIKRVANGAASLDEYLKTSTPKVIDVLLRQGKIEQAQAYQKFIGSQEGQNYARAWTDGVRRFSIGDTKGALKSFENLYNSQLYSDGNTVKLTPGRDPSTMTVTQIGQDGKPLGETTVGTDQLLSQAALYLAPHEAVKHYADQNAKRTSEAAQLASQQAMEGQRQAGREALADRTDARTQAQIAAADARSQAQIAAADQRLTRTLDARASPSTKPLTAAQQRSNLEIDAAREYVSGLDPEEIRRRTAKTTNTGRENPDYDPALARQSGLAARRKMGDDDQFDSTPRPPSKSPGELRKEVAKRFGADRTMNKYALGKDTDKGVEVLDGRGKLIGYYR